MAVRDKTGTSARGTPRVPPAVPAPVPPADCVTPFWTFGASAAPANTATNYLNSGAHSTAPNTTEGNGVVVSSVTGLLRNLVIIHGAANADSFTYTVRINGIDTALVAVMPAAGTLVSNLLVSVAVNIGDKVSVQMVQSGTTAGAAMRPRASLAFTCDLGEIQLLAVIGASDATGQGPSIDLPANLQSPFVVPFAFNYEGVASGAWQNLSPQAGKVGCEITYGRTRAVSGEQVGVIKFCVNTTEVRADWLDGAQWANAAVSYFLAQVLLLGRPYAFKALYIDIGGREALTGAAVSDDIGNALEELADVVRTGLGAPNMHLVIAELATYLVDPPYTWMPNVRAAEEASFPAAPQSSLIDPVGGAAADGIHRSTAAQQSAGNLAAAAVPL